MTGQGSLHSSDDDTEPCSPGKEPELIALLLEEYKSLRAEVTQRLAARMQVLALTSVIAALITASGGLTPHKPNLYIAILVLLVGLLLWRGGNRMIPRIAHRLRQLERRMNELAIRAYGAKEGPFGWETTLYDQRATAGRAHRLIRRFGGWW